MSRAAALLTILGTLTLGLAGCGTKQETESPVEHNIRSLAVLVGRYRGFNQGKAPASPEALKAFLKAKGPGESALKSVGLQPGEIDSLFQSPRDGKPFVYLAPKGGTGMPAMPGPDGKTKKTVVFYESVGASGSRWVAYDLGAIELVDDATFKQLVPDAP